MLVLSMFARRAIRSSAQHWRHFNERSSFWHDRGCVAVAWIGLRGRSAPRGEYGPRHTSNADRDKTGGHSRTAIRAGVPGVWEKHRCAEREGGDLRLLARCLPIDAGMRRKESTRPSIIQSAGPDAPLLARGLRLCRLRVGGLGALGRT